MNISDEGISSGSSVDVISDQYLFRQGPHVSHGPNSGDSPNGKHPLSTKISKYESEGEHASGSWLSHSCHILVLTFSGKPVYTRYGGEDLIAGFSGTLQALVSKFALTGLSATDDRLRNMTLGSLRIEFVDKSPLCLVCISRHKSVPRESLRRLLAAVHTQLIFVLTSGINNTLLSRPSFDVRTLLGGTKPLLGNLISWMNRDMLLAIDDAAIEPLPLPLQSRSNIMKMMQENCPDCCLLGLLLAGHRVVATLAGADSHIALSASDVVLLINLVISSTSMRSSESWTPICLPSISSEAFVYAYVQFFTGDVSYVCISLSPDNANFYAISNHAESIKSRLTEGDQSGELKTVNLWESKTPLSLSVFDDSDGTVEKQEALSRIRHCAIVLNQSRQIFSSRIAGKNDQEACKDVFRCYQHGMAMLKSADSSSASSQQISMTFNDDFVFVWTTVEFQLFLTAPRGADVSVITYVYQWMRENEQSLFIPNLAYSGASGTRLSSKAISLCEMDRLMAAMHDSSASMATYAAQNVVTKDQILAAGDAATAQQAMNLIDQEMQELMQPDPSSTVGQPGDPSTQKFVYAPPRNVIIMPKIHWGKPTCHSESWWSKKLLPVPKREMDLSWLARRKMVAAPGISEKDAKYPLSIPNFPIKFDRVLGYREFLS